MSPSNQKRSDRKAALGNQDFETGCCIIRKGNQRIRAGRMTEAECEERAREEGGSCIWNRGENC
jgi:hypothetical protein